MRDSELKGILENLLELRRKAETGIDEGDLRTGYLRGMQDVIRMFMPDSIRLVPEGLHATWQDTQEDKWLKGE